jgi:hypothetical protein
VAVAAAAALLMVSEPALAQAAKVQQVAAKRVKVDYAPRVYLLRGFLNVFSLGLDDLGADLNKIGIHAETFGNESNGTITAKLIEDYKNGKRGPIILVGHSLGAPAVVYMADRLTEAGVPTAMVISLDPIIAVTSNARVGQLLNFYVSNGPGQQVRKGPRFRGTLRNIDLKNRPDIGHVSIAQSRELHRELVRYIRSAARRPAVSKPAVAAKPAPASPDQPAATPASASPDQPAADASKASGATPESTSSVTKPAAEGAATAR